MPDQTQPRTFTIVAPTQGGTYAQTLGWSVRDSTLAWSPCIGTKRDCERYAAAMNRRVREGSL